MVVGVGLALTALPRSAAAAPRTHDGFFFQGSLGFGPGWLTETYDDDAFLFDEISFSGLTVHPEILIGGTLAPGLVLGGALTGHSMVNPTAEVDGQEAETEDTTVNFSQLSAFVHYYPSPAQGLYLHGSLGVVGASITVDDDTTESDAVGFTLGAGVGYDFWIANEWSLGPQFRFTYAHLSGEEEEVEFTDSFISPTLSLSVTYH
jgi:opacity protein-like surface antigen